MAALLRSGKFLRVVSGLARPNQGGTTAQSGLNGPACADAGTSSTGANGGSSWLVPSVDLGQSGSSFSAWSLQMLEGSLPSAGLDHRDSKDKSEEPCPPSSDPTIPHHVTRSEVLELLRRISSLDTKAAASTSVLVLRLCGNVLAEDISSGSERTELVNAVWTELEQDMKVPMTVEHYNALLSAYSQNGHEFCPEQLMSRLKKQSVAPNQDTYESLLERYCQEGNMEGADRMLRCMRDQGYVASRSVFHCLIRGHSEQGDVKNARDIVPVMVQWNVQPDQDTYLTLCKALAKKGKLMAIKDAAAEAEATGLKLNNADLLELVNIMATNGHKEEAPGVLSLVAADADGFDNAAKKTISRLLSGGNEDVAFAVLCELPNGQKKRAQRARSFLEQLAKLRRPVSKLLWYAEEMSRQKILNGGLEILLQSALQQNNFSLALKLAEIFVQDGHTLSNDHSSALLKMCDNSLDVVAAVKAIGNNLSNSDIKETVIPHFEKVSPNTEDLMESLESAGLPLERFLQPLMDHLTDEGKKDEAEKVGKKLNPPKAETPTLKAEGSITSGSANTDVFSPCISPSPAPSVVSSGYTSLATVDFTIPPPPTTSQPPVLSAMIQVYDPATNVCQWVPLHSMCSMFRTQGRYWDLEQLLFTSNGSYTQEDRKAIYMYTLQSYMDHSLYDKAIYLAQQLEAEGLAYDFQDFHVTMKNFVESFVPPPFDPMQSEEAFPGVPTQWSLGENKHIATPPSINTSVAPSESAPTPLVTEADPNELVGFYHKSLKTAMNETNSDEALKCYRELESLGKPLNVTESSNLIEVLLKEDSVHAATEVTKSMLARDAYPMPKIFRFLLNRLAAMGEVEDVAFIGDHLSPKVKKEVSFDNRLCNAYLSANRADEFLSLLQNELATADSSNIQSIKDKFPRGGAMGLLENNPHLLDQYARLAHEFVRHDYVAPINVLWTYYFIQGEHDKALPLWNAYVKDCSQIMFQKVCQTARSTGDINMAAGLVELLHDANVTSGAQGIAYSCLLDVESSRGEYASGLRRLEAGMRNGVQLEDVNRTALLRIKTGLEKQGQQFPYEVPKKRLPTSEERSLSPVMN